MSTVSAINDVNFAHPRMIGTLYNYKMKEEIDKIEIANEAVNEFKTTKEIIMRRAARPKKNKLLVW